PGSISCDDQKIARNCVAGKAERAFALASRDAPLTVNCVANGSSDQMRFVFRHLVVSPELRWNQQPLDRYLAEAVEGCVVCCLHRFLGVELTDLEVERQFIVILW